ncbi:MAG: hypothetical protein EXS37_17155 [Opitutus sp.]|nr:hypothetical protein [Opitutus sp.]
MALGDFSAALPYLEAGVPVVQSRSLYYDSMWDPWREDPRFKGLIAKLGISAEYERAREELAGLPKEEATKK